MPDDDFQIPKASILDAFGAVSDNPREASNIVPAGTPGAFPAERRTGAIKVEVYRDEAKVLARLKNLAAAAGEDWYYRWPVKSKRTGGKEYVEGPSIKLANEVARVYGNCEVDTRVMDLGDSWLIYARFTDFESGYTLVRPYQQRKSQKTMGERATWEDPDRARDIAFQIGTSKAIRNVVTNALQTISDFAFEQAKESLVKQIGNDLKKYRDGVIKRLKDRDVDVRRVEAVVGRASADWLAPDIALIVASMKAVTDGMATLDETFPPLEKPEEQAKADKPPGAQMDAFSKEGEGSA